MKKEKTPITCECGNVYFEAVKVSKLMEPNMLYPPRQDITLPAMSTYSLLRCISCLKLKEVPVDTSMTPPTEIKEYAEFIKVFK